VVGNGAVAQHPMVPWRLPSQDAWQVGESEKSEGARGVSVQYARQGSEGRACVRVREGGE
jgi:hypothetical protein